jgi:hypothetical protein
MELTQEMADRFVGGQLEVQNRNENYLYRGEIATVKITGDDANTRSLTVTFNWFAQMQEDFKWSGSEPTPYTVSLLIYSVSDIGDGRLSLYSYITGETTVLFPPGGSKLDPAKVRNLVVQS